MTFFQPSLLACGLLACGLLAACSGNGTGGQNKDMNGGNQGDGGSGGMGDMMLGPPVPVTVTTGGSGTGTVTSQPAGISCGGAGAGPCMADFPTGSVISLTAQGSSSAFTGWTGACAGQSAICTVTVTGALTVSASFSPLACTPDMICWEAPLPFGYDLNSVWEIANNNVWAVGNGGSIVQYNGTGWSVSPSGTTNDLLSVWARNANDVWTVTGTNAAGNAALLHYTGSSWAAVDTGIKGKSTAVWGDNTNKLWVATFSPNVLYYNGTTWASFASGGRNIATLSGLTGTSATDVWVYGSDSTVSHWNGTGFAVQDRTQWASSGLVSAYSIANNDIWGVLGDGAVYKGTSTSADGFTLQTAKIGTNGVGINGLFGTSDSNLFSAGPTGLLYVFNGTSWTSNKTGSTDVYVYNGIHGGAANDVWAVGPYGVTAHWNGTAASVQRANVFSDPTGDNFVGVWGSSVNDVWFVSKNVGTVVHYDGTAYTESPTLVQGGIALNLFSVGGSGPNDVWVTGTNNSKALLLHYDGTSWTPATLPTLWGALDSTTNLVYAASPTAAWATGQSASNIMSWDGTQWTVLDNAVLPIKQSPTAIWGSSATDVWVADGSGTGLWFYNGNGWVLNNQIQVLVTSLNGTSSSDIWAGVSGGVYHFDGSNWTKMTITGSTQQIISISATATNDAWFVEKTTGYVFRWNGTTFRQIDTGLGTSPGAAQDPAIQMYSWAADAMDVWFAGRGILSYRP
jgi:uncharacterized repeat protein (TIGR02543 family)